MNKPMILLAAALIVAAPSYAAHQFGVPFRAHVGPSISGFVNNRVIDTQIRRSAGPEKVSPQCAYGKHCANTQN
jgi:hypothetical protein